MGRCQEFGSQIRDACNHPMRAGEDSCSCPACGVVCQGRFGACSDVWARGPQPVTFTGGTEWMPEPDSNEPRQLLSSNGFSLLPPPAAAPPPPPPPPPAPPSALPAVPAVPTRFRADVFKWFQDTFDELRYELHAVVSTVTHQQAMLAELLDARESEPRAALVAQSISELARTVESQLTEFRVAAEASEQSTVAVVDGMRELVHRMELAADLKADADRREASRREAFQRSVTSQLLPVKIAVAEVAAHIHGAQERDAARSRALRASVTKQIQPLASALETAIDRTDQQMAEIRERLDAMAGSPGPAPKSRRRAPLA